MDTLILADSNGYHWFDSEPNWSIHSFHVGKLPDMINMIKRSYIPPTVKVIIIAVGINYRNEGLNAFTGHITNLKDYLDTLQGITSKFLLVPQMPNFTPSESHNIAHLNKVAKDAFGAKDTINCPPHGEIECLHDNDPAHYNWVTGARMAQCVRNHLTSLN